MRLNTIVQLYPSRIIVREKRPSDSFGKVEFNYQSKDWEKHKKKKIVANFENKKNSFVLSYTSKKKILDSINSMHILSTPRKITMANGKQIFNYQMSFITLTLPSAQMHDDTFIKSNCLNQFLIELRKHYKVNNYVWKAELQKNENIHFHLITDKYIDFQALRRRWNRCINKLGYVDEYTNKMSKLTLLEYHKLRNTNGSSSFDKSATAFGSGQQTKWKNPNTVDVKSVSSKKDLAMYLAKYVTKPIEKQKKTVEENERETNFGRSWSRSYSLVKLKYQNKFTFFQVKHILAYLDSVPKLVNKVSSMFFEAYYFNYKRLCPAYQKFHLKFITANAESWQYPFP